MSSASDVCGTFRTAASGKQLWQIKTLTMMVIHKQVPLVMITRVIRGGKAISQLEDLAMTQPLAFLNEFEAGLIQRVEHAQVDCLSTILSLVHGVAEAVTSISRKQEDLKANQQQLEKVHTNTIAVFEGLVNNGGETVTFTLDGHGMGPWQGPIRQKQ